MVCSALFRVSPGAAPPLPSQLKVHFIYCSTNLWLIVEFLSLSLVVVLFMISQLSCEGITIVSPSPSVGGTPWRNYKPLLEPHHQNQNPAEWRYRTIKAWTNTTINRTGAPAYCWLLTLQYVCYILNHISTRSLGGQVPVQVLYGVTPDISIILLYTFYQPIFYATHDQHFPSESEERASYWVGFAEHCGDSLTHKVLDAETLRIIHGSALRPRTLKNPNKRLVDDGGEEDHQLHSKPKSDQPYTPTVYMRSRHDDGPTSSKPLPEFNPEDLVGRTFLLPLETMGRDKGQKSLERWLKTLRRQMGRESKTLAIF